MLVVYIDRILVVLVGASFLSGFFFYNRYIVKNSVIVIFFCLEMNEKHENKRHVSLILTYFQSFPFKHCSLATYHTDHDGDSLSAPKQ